MARFELIWNGRDLSNVGWENFTISKDFQGQQEDVSVNIGEIEIKGEDAVLLRKRALNGLTGGVGIFEADPVQLRIIDDNAPTYNIDMYIKFSQGFKILACNHIAASLHKRKSVAWLEGVANSASFRYMYDYGFIKKSDFVKVPYVINYVPDTMQLLFLSLSLFVMAKELYESIKQVSQSIADLQDAVTPVVGTGVGLGAVAVTAWDIGNIIYCALAVIFNVAYTIAIIYAIIKLIEEIFEQLMPKNRNHLGMRLYDLFERACQFYGLKFKSNLLASKKDWVLIPSKDHKGGQKPEGFKGVWTEVGFPTYVDNIDTFKDLIEFCKPIFLADFKIKNDTFIFETLDYFQSQANWQIPQVFTNQETLEDEILFNTDEVVSNYVVQWSTDAQDMNTVDNQQGQKFQAILEPISVNNKDLFEVQNLVDIQIGASLGVRKDSLTVVEKVLKELAKVVDILTAGATGFAGKIDARIGSLLTSTHYFSIPKMVSMSGAKLSPNQRDIFSAAKLYDTYHAPSNFVGANGNHGQYVIMAEHEIPFCAKDFVSLLDNNYALYGSEKARIDSIAWVVDKGIAIINFRINRKYTNNLKVKRLE